MNKRAARALVLLLIFLAGTLAFVSAERRILIKYEGSCFELQPGQYTAMRSISSEYTLTIPHFGIFHGFVYDAPGMVTLIMTKPQFVAFLIANNNTFTIPTKLTPYLFELSGSFVVPLLAGEYWVVFVNPSYANINGKSCTGNDWVLNSI